MEVDNRFWVTWPLYSTESKRAFEIPVESVDQGGCPSCSGDHSFVITELTKE